MLSPVESENNPPNESQSVIGNDIIWVQVTAFMNAKNQSTYLIERKSTLVYVLCHMQVTPSLSSLSKQRLECAHKDHEPRAAQQDPLGFTSSWLGFLRTHILIYLKLRFKNGFPT